MFESSPSLSALDQKKGAFTARCLPGCVTEVPLLFGGGFRTERSRLLTLLFVVHHCSEHVFLCIPLWDFVGAAPTITMALVCH